MHLLLSSALIHKLVRFLMTRQTQRASIGLLECKYRRCERWAHVTCWRSRRALGKHGKSGCCVGRKRIVTLTVFAASPPAWKRPELVCSVITVAAQLLSRAFHQRLPRAFRAARDFFSSTTCSLRFHPSKPAFRFQPQARAPRQHPFPHVPPGSNNHDTGALFEIFNRYIYFLGVCQSPRRTIRQSIHLELTVFPSNYSLVSACSKLLHNVILRLRRQPA